MKPYAAQVRLYGSVAVLTLCPGRSTVGRAKASLEILTDMLVGLGGSADSLILDLDRAPYPPPVDALAAIDAWAAQREIPVVTLTPSPHARPVPAHPGESVRESDAAVGVSGLRRALEVRVLTQRAAGIRRARKGAHPCS